MQPNTLNPQSVHFHEIRLQVQHVIQAQPKLTQQESPTVLGVSPGKVHNRMRALIDKSLVKIENFNHNQYKPYYDYLPSPKDIEGKAALTAHFLERKAAECERLKADREILASSIDLKTIFAAYKNTIGKPMKMDEVNFEGQFA